MATKKAAKKQGGAKSKKAAKKGAKKAASKSKLAPAMKKWGQVVAKAWADDKFKQRLLKDPAGVLKEHGLEAPKGATLRAVENTAGVHHIILPAKPEGAVWSAQDVESATVTSVGCCICGACTSCS